METTLTQNVPTIPALAKKIAEWFPEFGGRVVPVSDADLIKRDTMPTLPLVVIMLRRAVPLRDKMTKRRPAIREEIIVEFWFEPERHKKRDGTETPFWAFYDYDTIQAKLFTGLRYWTSPRGSYIEFAGFDVEATEAAVAISFTLFHDFYHCDVEGVEPCEPDMGEGKPPQFTLSMLQPINDCCLEPICDPPEPDPCAMPQHQSESSPDWK